MSFFEELKRRNVFRVGIAYIVVGWLLLQVTDIVVPILDLPEWVDKLVLFLIALGFPLVIFFAWAFELTPEGIKREKEVDRSTSITNVTGRKLDRAIIAVLVLALTWFAWDKFGKGSEPFSEQSMAQSQEAMDQKKALTPEKSIAVLPFVNMSDEAENEYFSDGISEEILNALASVDNLKVAGRTSSFAFKGRNEDLRTIGEALGVGHILEGSVRKAGNTVRITAQLIQVDDGFHLWSETFDRELTNVFAIQDEIAAAILTAMKAELLAGETEALAADETNPRAYELYLLSRQRIYERERATIESAVAMLDEALKIDPVYAPALAQRGIATLLLRRANYGDLTSEQAEPVAKAHFDRALAADPNSAEAWAGLGLYHSNRARETQLAIDALEKAVSINPNLIDAKNWLQQAYSSLGDSRKALEIVEDMFESDPLYPPALVNLVQGYNRYGAFDQSAEAIARVTPFLAGTPNFLDAQASLHLAQGDCVTGMPLLERSLELDPDSGSTKFGWGLCLLSLHQYERVLTEFMPPWQRIFSMHKTGRTEEATLAAFERAAIGDVNPLLALLNREDRPQDVVRFFDDRWTSVAQFDAEYPGGSFGNDVMLELAFAFSRTNDSERFEAAMQYVRADHDALLEQGIVVNPLYWQEAVYYALSGDEQQALNYLERAIAEGGMRYKRIAWQYPALKPLEGHPRFEAAQQKMIENINRQRVALGLEPLDV
ncbi:MAG: hypothetical protein KJO85_07320 [Gammaproteobacteria bacterium]|nr:hypothetical protein [Gammaproteobacteria bacterium]